MMKHKTFSQLASALFILFSASAVASSNTAGDAKAFDCMNKETFVIDSECMNQTIASNLVFKSAQKAVIESAEVANDRAMASMSFDSRTMTISIVAHKDATIAKADTSKLKSKK